MNELAGFGVNATEVMHPRAVISDEGRLQCVSFLRAHISACAYPAN